MRLLPRPLLALLLALVMAMPAGGALAQSQPGRFDYYLLSLSWSPQFCATRAGATAGRQCAPGAGRGFIAHGLWPEDADASYPTACRPSGRVPARLIDRVLPSMPDARLIQHEWSTHGTCSGLAMDDYFDTLVRAYRKVQIPHPLTGPRVTVATDAVRLKRLFAEANPGLSERAMTVVCADGWLEEVRICLDKSLNFRDCGAAEHDRCRGQLRFRPID